MAHGGSLIIVGLAFCCGGLVVALGGGVQHGAWVGHLVMVVVVG